MFARTTGRPTCVARELVGSGEGPEGSRPKLPVEERSGARSARRRRRRSVSATLTDATGLHQEVRRASHRLPPASGPRRSPPLWA